jgi:PAT family beta-lactamase induction signal transducer AmpG
MILNESRRLRIAAFTTLYFCQGVPIGLLDVAVPGWLAERGLAPSEIAGYTAVVALPWAFKLLAGPFMDRFRLPSMGHRRPWVMAAQFGLTIALTVLAIAGLEDLSLGWLAALGFLVNACGATQDVAVDGMAIDILPLDERGRANAFMGFGQVLGFSVFAAVGGWLIATWGLAAAAVLAAMVVGCVLVLVTVCLERRGDQRMPWGVRTTDANAPATPGMAAMFGDIARALLLPQSLVLTAAVVLVRIGAGVSIAMLPVLAVQKLGFSGAAYSATYGWIGAGAATLGLIVGPLIDRFGARRLLLCGVLGMAGAALVFASTSQFWVIAAWPIAMLCVAMLFEQVVFVSIIAQCMNITWARVAATQFAIYMALANLSRSVGAGLYSTVADLWPLPATIAVMAAVYLTAAGVLLRFDERRHRAQLADLEARRHPVVPAAVAGRADDGHAEPDPAVSLS